MSEHITAPELEAALEAIRNSPQDDGPLEWIVRRPAEDQREVLQSATVELAGGMTGDNWSVRPSSSTPDGSPHPGKQLTLMNTRVISIIAGSQERWALAGDQLYADLDLSIENLPAGTQLAVGEAILEVSPEPHLGCVKFVERFGLDAMKFVSSPVGKQLRIRGLNAKVVRPGTFQVGDRIRKA